MGLQMGRHFNRLQEGMEPGIEKQWRWLMSQCALVGSDQLFETGVGTRCTLTFGWYYSLRLFESQPGSTVL